MNDPWARVRLHDLLLQQDAGEIAGRVLGSYVMAHRLTAVRPDGHVGFRCRESDPDLLADWLDLLAARSPGRPVPAARRGRVRRAWPHVSVVRRSCRRAHAGCAGAPRAARS